MSNAVTDICNFKAKKIESHHRVAIQSDKFTRADQTPTDIAEPLPFSQEVIPILNQWMENEDGPTSAPRLRDLGLENPIPLTMTLELKRSDPFFDPTTWNWTSD
jgi:hypothetical protein